MAEKAFIWSFGDCRKIFYKKWNFSLHMKMHLNIKQFKCQLCGKEFTQKSNYNKHQKTHWNLYKNGNRKYGCEICLKRFSSHKKLWVSFQQNKNIRYFMHFMYFRNPPHVHIISNELHLRLIFISIVS